MNTVMTSQTRTALRFVCLWTTFLLCIFFYYLNSQETSRAALLTRASNHLDFGWMGTWKRNLFPVDAHNASSDEDYPGVFLQDDRKQASVIDVTALEYDEVENTSVKNFVPQRNVTENDDSDELDHDKSLLHRDSNDNNKHTSISENPEVKSDILEEPSRTHSSFNKRKDKKPPNDNPSDIVFLGRTKEPVRLLHTLSDQNNSRSTSVEPAHHSPTMKTSFIPKDASITKIRNSVISPVGAPKPSSEFERSDEEEEGEEEEENEEDVGNLKISTILSTSAFRDKKLRPPYLRKKNLHWTIANFGDYSKTLFSPPPGETPQQRLPQALIIGAGKCGTRALIEFLRMHPYIVPAGSEIHYFDVDENFNKGIQWYKSQMPLSFSNQMTIEKTPSYMWSERAVEEIYKLNSSMKLILIIKDPAERVISQAVRSHSEDIEAVFLRQNLKGDLEVDSESRTVDWGIYIKYLRMWTKRFPLSQIHVVEAKEFISNPAKEINKLEAFLNVPRMITKDNFYYNTTKGFYCMRPFHMKENCLSGGKGKPHPPLEPAHEKLLNGFYEKYNQELFQFLGRTFDWGPKKHSGL